MVAAVAASVSAARLTAAAALLALLLMLRFVTPAAAVAEAAARIDGTMAERIEQLSSLVSADSATDQPQQQQQQQQQQRRLAFTLPLLKGSVNARHVARFVESLRRSRLVAADATVFAEEVPLHQQVLNEKRLATYFGVVTIGGQQFKVLFDTGSCEFWVPSYACAEHTVPADRCSRHRLYDPRRSGGYRAFRARKKMTIQYLSGKVEGLLAEDTVSLGPMSVNGQVFGMADTVDVPLLDDVVWDGIVGLAYPNQRLTKEGVYPLFDTVMQRRLVQNNVFSYYLGYNGGAVTFGGVDQRFIAHAAHRRNVVFQHRPAEREGILSLVELESSIGAPAFAYAKVVEESYWTIEFEDVELQYGDDEPQRTGICANQENGRCRAIVDTGTYLIYGPRADVVGALGDVQLSSCSDVARLPKITFVMYAGDDAMPARLTLYPHDYTLEFHVPQEDGIDCNDPAYKSDLTRCRPDCVVGVGPDNDSGWTLGQVFLRSFYTVFDRDRNRIGFVRSNPEAM